MLNADITGYCARLIEETEDALQSAVYEDRVDSGNVEEFLCRSASPECDSVDFDEVKTEDDGDSGDDDDSVKEEDVAVKPKKQKKKRKTKSSSSNKKKKEL